MGGVADVDAGAGLEAHLLQCESQRGRMRLFVRSVTGADVRCEGTCQPEMAKLSQDAGAVAASHEAELIAAGDPSEHAASSGDEFRSVVRVVFGPEFVGDFVFRTRDFRRA